MGLEVASCARVAQHHSGTHPSHQAARRHCAGCSDCDRHSRRHTADRGRGRQGLRGAGCRGALASHIGCISYGTTATITTTQTRYIEPIPLIPPYPSAVPGAYSLEVQIYRGFWMVSWFQNEFGQPEQQTAFERGVPPELLLDELIADVPAGCNGLILQPYWSPGLKVPGPEAKGAVIGFADVHSHRAFVPGYSGGVSLCVRRRQERRSGSGDSLSRATGVGWWLPE